MLKTLIKLFLLPSLIILVPLMIMMHTLKSGAISVQSIKKGLVASGVYREALRSFQKSLLGFSVSDLESKAKDDTEVSAFAKTFTSVVSEKYVQGKIEKAIDDTSSWVKGDTKTPPSMSFDDLKTMILEKQKGTIDDIGSFLSELKDAVPKEQIDSAMKESGQSSESIPNPFDIQTILQKNPVIDLSPFVYWIKMMAWGVRIGWYITLVCVSFVCLFVLLLSRGNRTKVRWIGITGIYACIGIFLFSYLVRDPSYGISLIIKWIPKQYVDVVTLLFSTITLKPLLLFYATSQKLLQEISLISIALIVLSYLDIKNPSNRKNIGTVVIGILLIAGVYVMIFPKSSPIPFIGAFIGTPKLHAYTSSISKVESIGKSGGTISVVGVEGVSTLSVPKDSLLYKTSFKASSITSVTGLPPSAEFVTGIDFQASEALLRKPAKLEITLDAPPKKQIRGFAYSDNGKQLTIFPVTVSGNTVIIPVMHFSGYGIITVPDTFKSAQHANDVRTQSQQDILSFLSWIQVTQAFGVNEKFTDAQKKGLQDILTAWWSAGVKPFLEQSLRDTKEIVPAAKEYTIWLQAVQAFGFESYFSATIKTSETFLAKAIVRASEEASRLCTESHDPSQAGVLLKLYAIAEGLGLDGVGGLRVDTLKKQALNCARFKLTIESQFTVADGKVCPVGEDETYSGEIELTPDEDFTLSGKGIVKADSIQVCAVECRIEEGDGPVEATVEIPGVLFGASSDVKDISIPLVVTDDTRVQYDCSYTVPGTDTDFGYHRPFGWDSAFYTMHDEDRIGLFEYLFTGWQRNSSGDVFAIKQYDRIKKPTIMGMGVPVHEVTTLKLLHTPKK